MPSEVRTGDVVAGFRIEKLIGRGAVGSVYRAEDPSGRRVALKLLSAELADDDRFRQRFLRESELAASLAHPNVVPIVASGEHDGRLYLAMQHIDGSDLREVIRRDGRLQPERALDLLEQVAAALDAAHEAGLVHRDVKPGNILVSRPDGVVEHADVCDFGLARHVSSVSSLTGDRGFVGTIDYVPPEQIQGGDLDERADVYSLGCVLFECMAGERPFERDSELSVVFAHLNEPPPRLSEVRPDLPDAFDDLFATGLAKDPDDRYSTCGELVAAARAALRGERADRRRLGHRRYAIAGSIAALVLVATAAAVLTTGDGSAPPPVSITQTAIAGAKLALTNAQYKSLYGAGWREDVFTTPNFPVLIYAHRRQSIYFDPDTRRGIIVTTWNKEHRTAAGVGPCSSIEELKAAYGKALKPSPWNVQKGKVYAYLLGKNLLFAVSGPPPNPGKLVSAVALYDGDGPRDDGRGVDVTGGTMPFAGYVAISENTCS